MDSGNADFAALEKIDEFKAISDIFTSCEIGRDAASNAGLIVVQYAFDVQAALMTIPSMNGQDPGRRAKRVTRQLTQVSTMLHGIQSRFAKVPKVILEEYQQEINGKRRGRTRRPIDLEH